MISMVCFSIGLWNL